MKIGILTFHRTHNYGAVLQCFALQETIRKMGHDVLVINYVQPYIEHNNNVFYDFQQKFKSSPLHELKSIARYATKFIKSGDSFLFFRRRHLRLTSKCVRETIPNDFDCYLIGSDQLWSLECTKEIDPVFFGDFNHKRDSSVYGYAISGNESSLRQISTTRLANYVRNFTRISFREKSLSDCFLCLTKQNTRVDIDPTLLTDKSVWLPLIEKRWGHKDYVLIYQVRGGREQQQALSVKAQQLAKEQGTYTIDLSTYKFSPSEFVTAFKYAKCIVTSSFHGTAFALIFNKPLCAIRLNDGHDSRYVDLLSAVGAEAFLFDLKDELRIVGLNYTHITNKLEAYRQDSLQYLNMACTK